ncbi:MAG: ribonuclease P protein component [Myxococcota bacterium]
MQGTGRRIRSPHLLLVVGRGAEPVSRVGLTVSRKVGNAVTRNRVKRWLREAVRAVPGPRAGPWDLVLIPRPEAAEAGFVALSAEVADLFARVAR